MRTDSHTPMHTLPRTTHVTLSEKSHTKNARMQQFAKSRGAPGWERAKQTLKVLTAVLFKQRRSTYHLLITTSQRSGMTCGNSSHHVSLRLLTTQVTHPAISDESLVATEVRTLPHLRREARWARGTANTTNHRERELENVRQVSRAQGLTLQRCSRLALMVTETHFGQRVSPVEAWGRHWVRHITHTCCRGAENGWPCGLIPLLLACISVCYSGSCR